MPELVLKLAGDTLQVSLAGRSASLPWASVAPAEHTWERIYDDAAGYGRELFDKTFADEGLRGALANLGPGERLLLVAEDPLVAAVGWEYLRDAGGRLLAGRLNLVRGLPEAQRRAAPAPAAGPPAGSQAGSGTQYNTGD